MEVRGEAALERAILKLSCDGTVMTGTRGTGGREAWHKVMVLDGEGTIDSKKDEETKGDKVGCDPWRTDEV